MEKKRCPICNGLAFPGWDGPVPMVRCYGECKVRVWGATPQEASERWNKMDKAEAKDRLKNQMLTKVQLEESLEAKLAKGEITAEEAEWEWQDWMHRYEVWSEW